MLRFYQSLKIADIYPASLQCWDIRNPKILLSYILSYDIAELIPILEHFLHCGIFWRKSFKTFSRGPGETYHGAIF